MGFPGLDETVKFNVLKHLANCCSGDQRPTTAADNSTKTDMRNEAIRTQEREAPIPANNASKVQSTLTSIGQIIDARTVGEKRLIYQQLFNRANSSRIDFTLEMKSQQHQLPINSVGRTPSEQKHPLVNNDIGPLNKIPLDTGSNNINNNNNNDPRPVLKQGFKAPHKTYKKVSNLIKPVPQMPEKLFISNGIRFMPATVLVPVQVGYTPVHEYKQNKVADEKNEVWRPWEKMGDLVKDTNLQAKTVFSL